MLFEAPLPQAALPRPPASHRTHTHDAAHTHARVGKLEEGWVSRSLPEGGAGGVAHTHARVGKLEGEGVSILLPEGGADGAAHTYSEGKEEGGVSRSLVPADAAHTHTRVGKLLPLPPRVVTAGHAAPPPAAAAAAAAAALAPTAAPAATGEVPPIPEVDGGGCHARHQRGWQLLLDQKRVPPPPLPRPPPSAPPQPLVVV